MAVTISSTALAELAGRLNVDSISLAIVNAREIVDIQTAVGRPSARRPDAQSIFQAASLSKSVFSYLLFKLIDQGTIELDVPVSRYLPDTTKEVIVQALARSAIEIRENTNTDAITVRLLLSHTSGLPSSGTTDTIKFESIPGTDWQYSGLGFQVLQRAVEHTTGEPLNEVMKRLVFGPLAMNRSTFVFDKHSNPNIFIGTDYDGTPVAPNFPSGAVAAHSMTTTAEDCGKFLVALLGDEKALGKITERIFTVDEEINFRWGLGFGVEPYGDDSFIWQWGKFNGYRAFVMGSVRSGDGFAMLTNSANGLLLARLVAEQILPAQHKIFEHDWLNS